MEKAMSFDDKLLWKMHNRLEAKKAPSRFTENAMPTQKKITFSRENFKTNVSKIGAGLRSFGEKHPNLRDPSWMLSDDPFGMKPRPQHHKKKHHHKSSGGTHIHVHIDRR